MGHDFGHDGYCTNHEGCSYWQVIEAMRDLLRRAYEYLAGGTQGMELPLAADIRREIEKAAVL